MVQLRRFLYLDNQVVNEFLSQLQGGLIELMSETQTANKDRKLGGKAGVPGTGFGVEVSGGKVIGTSATQSLRESPESAFQRLYSLLEGLDGIQSLDGFDEGIWQQLKKQEVVEISATLDVPQDLAIISALAPDDGEQTRTRMRMLSGLDDDQELDEMIAASQALRHVFPRSAVVGTALGAPDYRFVLPLNPGSLRVDLMDSELLGDVSALGTITRVIPSDQSWSVLDIANRTVATEMDLDEFDSTVPGPAAVLNTIAIYV